jgi:hypothetical protein
MNNFQRALILPEARLLLDIISRLGPVDSVVDIASAGELPISVCFRDSQSFRPFKVILSSFRGSFRWVAMAHLPYTCVVPLVQESGLAASQDQTRTLAIQDIKSLAKFVERELHLEGIPSHGVVVRHIEKSTGEVGPGGPALLVANPRQYLSNGFVPTSGRDRTIEYWISDEEGDILYERLHPSQGTPSHVNMELLDRICESKYEDLIILPSEVGSLREQCDRMADSSADLKPAMLRVARICEMASSDGLGIVVLGK